MFNPLVAIIFLHAYVANGGKLPPGVSQVLCDLDTKFQRLYPGGQPSVKRRRWAPVTVERHHRLRLPIAPGPSVMCSRHYPCHHRLFTLPSALPR